MQKVGPGESNQYNLQYRGVLIKKLLRIEDKKFYICGDAALKLRIKNGMFFIVLENKGNETAYSLRNLSVFLPRYNSAINVQTLI
jgi:hypothetical protein